jgi:hypothetical protein
MKVLDYSPIPFDGGKLSLQDRLKGISKFGSSWVSEMKSQEFILETLNRVLDNRFTMLRNLPLLKRNKTIPLILLGPYGITVIHNCTARGIFNAEGEVWKEMDNRINDFKTSRPNYIKRTIQITNEFRELIQQIGSEIDVDGVLIFSNPGSHVRISGRASVRIILMDAINRFGTSLLSKQQILTMENIRNLVVSITEAIQPEDTTDESKRIIPYQQYLEFAHNVDESFMRAIAPIEARSRFSKGQWAFLWIFAIIDFLVLIAFVVFVLMTA